MQHLIRLSRSRRRAGAVTLAVAAVSVAIAGSASAHLGHQAAGGESAKTPTQVLADAEVAVEAAPAVTIIAHDAKTGDSLNIHCIGTTMASGTLTLKGVQISLLRIGSTVYLKGGPKLWGKNYRAIGSRWVPYSLTKGSGRFYSVYVTLDRLAVAELTLGGTLAPTLTTATVGTTPVVLLTTPGTPATTVTVTDDDTAPLPLAISTLGKKGGSATFTYGGATTLAKPTNIAPFHGV